MRQAASSNSSYEWCIAALEDDFVRQGCSLTRGDVARLISQVGITGGSAARVWKEVAARGMLNEPAPVERKARRAPRPLVYEALSEPDEDLLTSEEEVELSRRYRTAKLLRELANAGEDEDKHIAEAIRDGLAARDRMIKANLRLVIWAADKFRRTGAFDTADLCQEGVIALMRAVDGFDPELGFRFST